MEAWQGFKGTEWQEKIDVRDFINQNITVYEGDDSFLAGPTEATTKLWDQVMELTKAEREAGGVLDLDTKIVSTITSHEPGYLNKDLETIVGFQTDEPFKRVVMPFGGIRMVESSCNAYGFELDEEIKEIFTKYRKTHTPRCI